MAGSGSASPQSGRSGRPPCSWARPPPVPPAPGPARAWARLRPDLGEVLDEVLAWRNRGAKVCLVASGDPGFFGLARLARARLGPNAVKVHPAPSSVALAFARLGMAWDDALVVSAHGRPLGPAVEAILTRPKVAVLTAPDYPPEALGERLLDAGWEPGRSWWPPGWGSLARRCGRAILSASPIAPSTRCPW